MALRNGHGTGAGMPRIEVLPVDELPVGEAAPRPTPQAMTRPPYPAGSPEAKEAGRRGGQARAGKTRLADRLGLRTLPVGSDFAPYKASAVSFRRAQCAALAASVGGGYCGPGPSSFVASAAVQLAWSRYFSDLAASVNDTELSALVMLERKVSRADIVAQSSRLANDSRQNLLAAHELCAREAEARRAAAPANPHRALAAALEERPS